jgi:hypothetical protein
LRIEQPRHEVRAAGRTKLAVIRIDLHVIRVVDARSELRRAPVVERVREQEAAGGAAPVIDRMPVDREPRVADPA